MATLGANVFITGANRGIGLGLVNEVLKMGGIKNLFAGCRNPDGAEDLKDLQQSNEALKIIKIDVLSDESIELAADQVSRILGENEGLNLLVNNSGILDTEGVTIQQPNRAVFKHHFDTNTIGVAMITASFLPLLRKAADAGQPSRVVNITSILGGIAQMVPMSMIPSKNVVYGMSKAALNHYTKALALDEPAVTAVAIHPGWVKTDMGGPNAHITIAESTAAIVKQICQLAKEDSGKFMDFNGKEMTP